MYVIRLSILQRPSDFEYLGELYLDPNYKNEGQLNEVACHFPLGTKAHADRYLEQFMDIFTEGSGRKWVRTSPGNDQATQVINKYLIANLSCSILFLLCFIGTSKSAICIRTANVIVPYGTNFPEPPSAGNGNVG